MATIAEFDWKCPHCANEQHEDVDDVMGPFVVLRCKACDENTYRSEVGK